MSKANQKAVNGPKLDPEEIQMMGQRDQICQMKNNDLIRASREFEMLRESAAGYLHSLVMKYEMDPMKRYTFNGTSIIEFREETENPTSVPNTKPPAIIPE